MATQSNPTEAQIRKLLRKGCTAKKFAAFVGVTKQTAYQRLDHLADTGVVTRERIVQSRKIETSAMLSGKRMSPRTVTVWVYKLIVDAKGQ